MKKILCSDFEHTKYFNCEVRDNYYLVDIDWYDYGYFEYPECIFTDVGENVTLLSASPLDDDLKHCRVLFRIDSQNV